MLTSVSERLHSIHWFRTDSLGNLLPTWARLGPLSVNEQGAALSHRRFDRGSFRCDRAPNGVAWRFPDWTAVGFAFPSAKIDHKIVEKSDTWEFKFSVIKPGIDVRRTGNGND
jgi:hypothetical protein